LFIFLDTSVLEIVEMARVTVGVKSNEEYSLQELMGLIEEIVNKNPDPIQRFWALYQFDIHGEEEASFQLHFQDGGTSVRKGEEAPADCTLKMSFLFACFC